jgi:hypothetical protein
VFVSKLRVVYGQGDTARKRRLARARALPEAEAAKLGGANTTLQIIILEISYKAIRIVFIRYKLERVGKGY